MRNLILFLAATFQLCVSLQAFAATIYEGSHRPYPVPSSITEYPDSLQPFYISHVGRHGSRYPSSASNAKYINFYLDYADTTNTITRAGRQMMEIADNIIDLGPDGGVNGGTIVAQGTPEEVAKVKNSYTGQYLKNILNM